MILRELVPHRLLLQMFFDRDLSQGAPIGAAMAADSPLFNPLLLDIGLTAGGTDKDSFFVQHTTLGLHDFPLMLPTMKGSFYKKDGIPLSPIARTEHSAVRSFLGGDCLTQSGADR